MRRLLLPFVFLGLGGSGLIPELAIAQASSKTYAIDIDPRSPTLGEALDREERARQKRPEPKGKSAPPKHQGAVDDPLETGALMPSSGLGRTPVVTRIPHVPRDAATVILPRGGQGQSLRMVRQIYPVAVR
ncbi:hypothetical protein MCEMSEM23_01632 [Rhabdaerophilaceae bacterium]